MLSSVPFLFSSVPFELSSVPSQSLQIFRPFSSVSVPPCSVQSLWGSVQSLSVQSLRISETLQFSLSPSLFSSVPLSSVPPDFSDPSVQSQSLPVQFSPFGVQFSPFQFSPSGFLRPFSSVSVPPVQFSPYKPKRTELKRTELNRRGTELIGD